MRPLSGCTLLIVLVLSLLLTATAAHAQIPQKMNYQVMLTDDANQPLADQSVEMVFTLYDVDLGGAALWTETQNVTTNSVGVVSVILGAVNLIDIPFDAPRWLEIEVDGETLSPRREIVSAPYAGHAAMAVNSDRLGDIDASEYALLSDIGAVGDGHSLDADDGSPVDAVYVNSSGDVQVGVQGDGRALLVGGTHVDNAAVSLKEYSQGGTITLRDETGSPQGVLSTDTSPGGGSYLRLYRNDGSDVGFILDGNHNGTEEPRMRIQGSTGSVTFDMSQSGTNSVSLPIDAVSDYEIVDEPGVASIQAAPDLDLPTGSVTTVAARTITVPSSGFVFVMGTAQLTMYNYDAGTDCVWFGVSEYQNAWSGAAQETKIQLSAGLDEGWYYFQATAQGLFEVGAGSNTFYLNALQETGDSWVSARQLSLMFFPTAYGSVDVTD